MNVHAVVFDAPSLKSAVVEGPLAMNTLYTAAWIHSTREFALPAHTEIDGAWIGVITGRVRSAAFG